MKRYIPLILLTLFAAGAPLPQTLGAEKPVKTEKKEAKSDGRENEIKERLKQRYPKIQELKKQGVVGETFEGYIDFVKGAKGDAKQLVDSENSDRKEVFQIIADRTGTTVDKVAERAGKRAFEKASAGEFLKDASGKWTKKS
ncbi:MAG TPA: YdbL family protein [Tepidisphaeraceae bacterium]|jgi:hypothetical protein